MKSALWAMALVPVLAVGLVGRAQAQPEVAKAKIINSQGKTVGDISIEHMASATLFLINVRDMPPGVHGIHIHSVGRCEPPTFDSAGPHFNPFNKQHGMHNPQGPHAGDLPNITIPSSGKLETQIMIAGMMQWEGEGGLLDGDGASIVIHANPDDYKTDPSGNSGARIACGKIDLPERQN
jgi:Cu-Zn family superoxide dismutase